MPAFVIHALGQAPRKVVVDSSPIRVGRDPTADIILQEASVSRDHAVFLVDEKGKWHVSCVSDTNPIMVNGAVITTGAVANEGTEVLIGTSHLLIFSMSAATATRYMDGTRQYEQAACEACKWSGMVGALSKDPKCPRCARPLKVMAAYTPESLRSVDKMDEKEKNKFFTGTAQMSFEQAKAQWTTMKAAKLSHVDRVDGRDPEKAKVQLGEGKTIELSKAPEAALRLAGLVFGKVMIGWESPHYVATSALSFPSMKVNGKKAKVATLASGDVIEVGSNRFRFSTGKGS